MSIAAASVIGEKQARTLEPLLVTPLTTLRAARRQAAGGAPAGGGLAIVALGVVPGGHCRGREPGVFGVLLAPGRSGIVFLLGPLAATARLAAGHLRVVAGQRCANRAAARGVRDPADSRAAARPVSRRPRVTGAVILLDRAVPAARQRHADVGRDQALRSRDDPHAVEVMKAATRPKSVAWRASPSSIHAMPSSTRPTIARQWQALASPPRPISTARSREHDRFVEALERVGRRGTSAAPR